MILYIAIFNNTAESCLESRYKAVPVFSLLRHIGDAPVHWHEETSSCGDILPVEESARQYQC